MKLTNTIRDAFVRAAMDDVPSIDYDEQAHKLAQEDLVKQMAPKLRAIYQDKQLRTFLGTEYTPMPCDLSSAYLYGAQHLELSKEADTQLEALAEKKAAQEDARHELRNKLRAVAYSATTRKALVEALPEFEKYLPTEATTSRSLPVIANLVSDFVKAGWPKGQEQAA